MLPQNKKHMKPIIKRKSWWWNLTIFGGQGVTTAIGDTIYLGKGASEKDRMLIDHEKIHLEQQKRVGLVKFVFLYLFCLPFVYNPYRWKWEFEAYDRGTRMVHWRIKQVLGSKLYGWLKPSWHS